MRRTLHFLYFRYVLMWTCPIKFDMVKNNLSRLVNLDHNNHIYLQCASTCEKSTRDDTTCWRVCLSISNVYQKPPTCIEDKTKQGSFYSKLVKSWIFIECDSQSASSKIMLTGAPDKQISIPIQFTPLKWPGLRILHSQTPSRLQRKWCKLYYTRVLCIFKPLICAANYNGCMKLQEQWPLRKLNLKIRLPSLFCWQTTRGNPADSQDQTAPQRRTSW